MAAALLPLAALAAVAHAAPQGHLGLSGSANAGAGAGVNVAAPPVSISSDIAKTSSVAAALTVPTVNGVAGVLPVKPPVSSVAAPTVASPGISGQSVLTGVPAVLVPSASLPTGSLSITIPTTVSVAATSIISSLGSLPVNVAATSAVSSVLAAGTPDVSPLPTNGLPLGNGLDINSLIDSLGDEVFDSVASSLAELFASVTRAAGSAVQTPDAASILSALQGLPTATPVAAVPNAPSPAISGPGGLSGRCSDGLEEANEKRQLQSLQGGAAPGLPKQGSALPAASAIPSGSTGLPSSLTSGVSGPGGVTNAASSVTGLLSSSPNPLSLVTNVLSGGALSTIPGLGGISDSLPIGSVTSTGTGATNVVMGKVQSLALPAQFAAIVAQLSAISTLDLNSILAGSDVLAQIQAITSMGSTLAALNPGSFGSLASLTNLGQIQSLALLTDIFDLATILDVLTSPGSKIPGLGKRDSKRLSRVTSAAQVGAPLPLDSLLANPTSFFAVVEALAPQLSCLPCVVGVAILEQSGVLGVQDLVQGINTTAVTGILSKLPRAGQ